MIAGYPAAIDLYGSAVDLYPAAIPGYPAMIDPLPGLVDPYAGLIDLLPGITDPLPEMADPYPGIIDPWFFGSGRGRKRVNWAKMRIRVSKADRPGRAALQPAPDGDAGNPVPRTPPPGRPEGTTRAPQPLPPTQTLDTNPAG